MSLLQLLSVGQSLITTKREHPHFRPIREGYLPKFEAEARLARSAHLQAALEVQSKAETKPVDSTSRSASCAAVLKTKTGTARQCELALDSVKVVRNDLFDSDIEVVPGQPGRVVEPEPVPTADATASQVGLIWNRLTARLFETGRARIRT